MRVLLLSAVKMRVHYRHMINVNSQHCKQTVGQFKILHTKKKEFCVFAKSSQEINNMWYSKSIA